MSKYKYKDSYNQKNYKKLVAKADIGEQNDDDALLNSILVKEPEPELDKLEVVELFIKYVDDNLLELFDKTDEIKVADAILEIFKKRENIDIFNKKAVFIYVKEMADTQSNTITKVIKKLKNIYKTILNEYLENNDY